MKSVSRWAARRRRNQAQRRAALRFVGALYGALSFACWSVSRYEESEDLAAFRDRARKDLRACGASDEAPALLIGRRSSWMASNFEVAVHLGFPPDGALATEQAVRPIPVAERAVACARFIDGIVNDESDDVLWSPFEFGCGSVYVYARTCDEERALIVQCSSTEAQRLRRRIFALVEELGVRMGDDGMEYVENR